MLDRIIHFSLTNRLAVVLIAALLMVSGWLTTNHMEVDVFPDLNAPTVAVMTEAQGMAAEEVEKLVTFPIETALNGAVGVRRVRSSSTTGFSVVWIEFEWGTDIYKARQIVNERLAVVATELPEGVSAPTPGPISSILGEMLIVGLTADSTSLEELRTIADWVIRPRLISEKGVAQVAVIGGDEKEYVVALDAARMKHYGISISEVEAACSGMTANQAAGQIYQYGNEYIVRTMLSSNDPEELASITVKEVSGNPVRLADIADVHIGAKEPKIGVASVKAHPAVLLTISKQPGAATIDLTKEIDKVLADIQSELPEDLTVHTDIFRQEQFINSAINNVKKSILEGGIFVVIILFLFLMNGRTTLISLVSIPLSFVVSLLVLNALGLNINTMSLGGFAIAIGSLVDDAIVDVENVHKRLRENRALPEGERKSTLQVTYEASREVRMPIINSTLIIIVTFIPLFFLSGVEGRMLIPLGIAFISSLVASTIVALTVTPALSSYLLGGKHHGKRADKETAFVQGLKRFYTRSLRSVINHRKVLIGITLALFVLSVCLIFTFKRSFLPPFNEGSFTINIASMPGISLEESDAIGREAELQLLQIPEIITTGRKTGRAELDEHALGINMSEIEAPYQLKGRSKEAIEEDVRERLSAIAGINVEVGQPISHRIDAILSGTRANIAIKLFGNDIEKLYSYANQIKEVIETVPNVVDLNVEQLVSRPETRIIPNNTLLAEFGITPAEFAKQVRILLSGEVVSHIYEENRVFNLVVRASGAATRTMDEIRELLIDAGAGKIPLYYVADVRSEVGPSTIQRENAARRIVISTNVKGGDLTGTVEQIRKRINENIHLPEGYYITYGGQFESATRASQVLLVASLVALLIVFLLLFGQFKSFTQAAIILLNLPLALIGGILIIFFTDRTISIPSVIGFISLFGIATRNGMLLVSHYNTLRSKGHTALECVMIGSAERINPILMTALTSALALIPLVIAGAMPGNEIQSPMARVILGGLITSTLLNAYLVPIVYLLSERRVYKEQTRKHSLTE